MARSAAAALKCTSAVAGPSRGKGCVAGSQDAARKVLAAAEVVRAGGGKGVRTQSGDEEQTRDTKWPSQGCTAGAAWSSHHTLCFFSTSLEFSPAARDNCCRFYNHTVCG